MAEFLTEEWVELLRATVGEYRVDPQLAITIEQKVTRSNEPALTWHLVVNNGVLEVATGPARNDATRVAFCSDEATARAIASGRASAQRLFLEGRLRLDGDVGLLLAARAALDRLGDGFAAVRAQTTGLDS